MHHGTHRFLGSAFGKSEHHQSLDRFIGIPARSNRTDGIRIERSQLAGQLDDDFLSCLEPQTLDVLQPNGFSG